jgi:hypothetical protein
METQLVLDAMMAIERSAGLVGKPIRCMVPELDVVPAGRSKSSKTVECVDLGGQRLVIEAKQTIDRVSSISTVCSQLQRIDLPDPSCGTLLVTEYLSPTLLQTCREIGLNAVDASGNVFLESGEKFVFVSGRPRRHQNGSDKLGWSSSAVKVGLVLLAHPSAASTTLRNIAELAVVSLGSVGKTLAWFEERRFLVRSDSAREHRVLRRDDLLDEWAVAFASRLRPRLDSRRFSRSSSGKTDWWKSELLPPAVWSGEVAGAKLFGELRPQTYEVYVAPQDRSAWLSGFVRAHRLGADRDGTIIVRDRFWGSLSTLEGLRAPLPIVYADLLAIPDPRAASTAKRVRDELLSN